MRVSTERRTERRENAHRTPIAYRLARATVRDAGAAVADQAKQQLHAAQRAARKGVRRAEDAADDVALRVRRHPFRAVTMAFAAGSALGAMLVGLARGARRA